ncbi:MAG: hypothetical protein ACHBNF_09520 [Chromatiales bacterium]
MRLYSRKEFEADIKKRWRLTSTDEKTATTRAWKTHGGCFITIPILATYPDYWLETIKELIEAAEGGKQLPWFDS